MGAPLKVHFSRSAPQPQIGIIGLARTVHAASHDRDRDRVILRELGHLFDAGGQFDERLIFYPGATRATDDVERLVIEFDDASYTSGLDIRDDLSPGIDFLGLPVVGQGQGDADGVPDPLSDQLLEGDPRLNYSIGGHPCFGDAQVERHIGTLLGEPLIDLHDLCRVAILQRNDVLRKAE